MKKPTKSKLMTAKHRLHRALANSDKVADYFEHAGLAQQVKRLDEVGDVLEDMIELVNRLESR